MLNIHLCISVCVYCACVYILHTLYAPCILNGITCTYVGSNPSGYTVIVDPQTRLPIMVPVSFDHLELLLCNNVFILIIMMYSFMLGL